MSNETFTGQRSAENMQKLNEQQQRVAAQAVEDAMKEASGDVEEVLKYLANRWTEMGFTPEQWVWCIALVTINMRETFPEKNGGKAAFDRIAADAQDYYRKNT